MLRLTLLVVLVFYCAITVTAQELPQQIVYNKPLYLDYWENAAIARKGQGSKLIKGMCRQLKGQYSYQNVSGIFLR